MADRVSLASNCNAACSSYLKLQRRCGRCDGCAALSSMGSSPDWLQALSETDQQEFLSMLLAESQLSLVRQLAVILGPLVGTRDAFYERGSAFNYARDVATESEHRNRNSPVSLQDRLGAYGASPRLHQAAIHHSRAVRCSISGVVDDEQHRRRRLSSLSRSMPAPLNAASEVGVSQGAAQFVPTLMGLQPATVAHIHRRLNAPGLAARLQAASAVGQQAVDATADAMLQWYLQGNTSDTARLIAWRLLLTRISRPTLQYLAGRTTAALRAFENQGGDAGGEGMDVRLLEAQAAAEMATIQAAHSSDTASRSKPKRSSKEVDRGDGRSIQLSLSARASVSCSASDIKSTSAAESKKQAVAVPSQLTAVASASAASTSSSSSSPPSTASSGSKGPPTTSTAKCSAPNMPSATTLAAAASVDDNDAYRGKGNSDDVLVVDDDNDDDVRFDMIAALPSFLAQHVLSMLPASDLKVTAQVSPYWAQLTAVVQHHKALRQDALEGMMAVRGPAQADERTRLAPISCPTRAPGSSELLRLPSRDFFTGSFACIRLPDTLRDMHHLFVAVDPRGRHCITGGASRDAVVRDAVTGEVLARVRGHAGGVLGGAELLSRDVYATASMDASVRLWQRGTLKPVGVLHGHIKAVSHLAWDELNDTLVSASLDRRVILWDLDLQRPHASKHVVRAPGSIHCLAIHHHVCAVGLSDASVTLFDISSRKFVPAGRVVIAPLPTASPNVTLMGLQAAATAATAATVHATDGRQVDGSTQHKAKRRASRRARARGSNANLPDRGGDGGGGGTSNTASMGDATVSTAATTGASNNESSDVTNGSSKRASFGKAKSDASAAVVASEGEKHGDGDYSKHSKHGVDSLGKPYIESLAITPHFVGVGMADGRAYVLGREAITWPAAQPRSSEASKGKAAPATDASDVEVACFTHPKAVSCLRLLYLRLVTGCADGSIRLFSLPTRQCVRIFRVLGNMSPVRSFAFENLRSLVVSTDDALALLDFGEDATKDTTPTAAHAPTTSSDEHGDGGSDGGSDGGREWLRNMQSAGRRSAATSRSSAMATRPATRASSTRATTPSLGETVLKMRQQQQQQSRWQQARVKSGMGDGEEGEGAVLKLWHTEDELLVQQLQAQPEPHRPQEHMHGHMQQGKQHQLSQPEEDEDEEQEAGKNNQEQKQQLLLQQREEEKTISQQRWPVAAVGREGSRDAAISRSDSDAGSEGDVFGRSANPVALDGEGRVGKRTQRQRSASTGAVTSSSTATRRQRARAGSVHVGMATPSTEATRRVSAIATSTPASGNMSQRLRRLSLAGRMHHVGASTQGARRTTRGVSESSARGNDTGPAVVVAAAAAAVDGADDGGKYHNAWTRGRRSSRRARSRSSSNSIGDMPDDTAVMSSNRKTTGRRTTLAATGDANALRRSSLRVSSSPSTMQPPSDSPRRHRRTLHHLYRLTVSASQPLQEEDEGEDGGCQEPRGPRATSTAVSTSTHVTASTNTSTTTSTTVSSPDAQSALHGHLPSAELKSFLGRSGGGRTASDGGGRNGNTRISTTSTAMTTSSRGTHAHRHASLSPRRPTTHEPHDLQQQQQPRPARGSIAASGSVSKVDRLQQQQRRRRVSQPVSSPRRPSTFGHTFAGEWRRYYKT
ncbi:hypothetical protein PTSG_07654 [Salpingoeca rosetta]|uniref:Uncharacterized protein n=1 Tax=Salpingoeca rosetta (strain ATCC 50818 / BSB-021) TaxID=946362 RepID=F2UHE0_SALR5|nr:uncharacterized protein PTSG_07654 [Salpingoeca rosetta]EGD76539.1 hypothetical protein PTSG_07654 [Salpingoeca rosetta]|eukprot:XP_004991453.1 hypothetical protein PTSG_07654 [Salpingoeca rosetta]